MKVGDYVKVTDVELKTKFPHAYKINNLSNNYVEIKIDGELFYISRYLLEVVGNPFNADSYAQKDEVNHPEHYTSGKYETIDIIKDSVDDFKSYVHGNIIKYILRYKKKGGVQDLKKAQVYLNWLIKDEEC